MPHAPGLRAGVRGGLLRRLLAVLRHHVLLLGQQLVVHVGDALRKVPCEPGMPLDVCHGDALLGVSHQNALQQVLALGRHLLVVRQLVVHAEYALHSQHTPQNSSSKLPSGLLTQE